MRGHIQKRGKNSWRICISLGKGPDGKYKYYYETVRGDKARAEKRQAELLLELQAGELQRVERMTVKQLLNRWMSDYVEANKTPNTIDFYRGNAAYIEKYLGHVEVQKLHSMAIQRMYATLLKEGGKDGQGLSPTTVGHVHSTLSACLNYGKTHGVLRSNPCESVSPPKPADYVPTIWTAEEMVRVLDVCHTERYGIYVVLVLYTGLRINEALALRWANVDLKRRKIAVVEAIKKFPRGKPPIVGKPKSKRGMRVVSFSADLAKALKEHKARQARERLAAGSAYENNDLVIATPTGGYVRPENIRNRTLRRLEKRAGVPRIELKNLRHVHATRLLEAGVHPKKVQERLGHADSSITMEIYSWVLPDTQDGTADAFDRIVTQQRARQVEDDYCQIIAERPHELGRP